MDTIYNIMFKFYVYLTFVLNVALKAVLFGVPAWLAILPVWDYFGRGRPELYVVVGMIAFLRVLYLSIFEELSFNPENNFEGDE